MKKSSFNKLKKSISQARGISVKRSFKKIREKRVKRVVLGKGYPVYLTRWVDTQRLIGLDSGPGQSSPMKKISGRKRIRLVAEVLE